MRTILAMAAMLGCGDAGGGGTPDATTPDAAVTPEFFGEPCELSTIPGYPNALVDCHGENVGVCYDEDMNGDRIGTCRPYCRSNGEPTPKAVCAGPQTGGIDVHWNGACLCLPP